MYKQPKREHRTKNTPLAVASYINISCIAVAVGRQAPGGKQPSRQGRQAGSLAHGCCCYCCLHDGRSRVGRVKISIYFLDGSSRLQVCVHDHWAGRTFRCVCKDGIIS